MSSFETFSALEEVSRAPNLVTSGLPLSLQRLALYLMAEGRTPEQVAANIADATAADVANASLLLGLTFLAREAEGVKRDQLLSGGLLDEAAVEFAIRLARRQLLTWYAGEIPLAEFSALLPLRGRLGLILQPLILSAVCEGETTSRELSLSAETLANVFGRWESGGEAELMTVGLREERERHVIARLQSGLWKEAATLPALNFATSVPTLVSEEEVLETEEEPALQQRGSRALSVSLLAVALLIAVGTIWGAYRWLSAPVPLPPPMELARPAAPSVHSPQPSPTATLQPKATPRPSAAAPPELPPLPPDDLPAGRSGHSTSPGAAKR